MTQPTIIVPLDGSELAERALPYAETLSRLFERPLFLVRAVEVHTFPGADPTDQQVKAVEQAETYLAGVAARLRQQGHSVESGVVYGAAGPAVIEEVGLRRADLVVMATHGRSGLGRWLYGSVADYVIHRAETPILLVPAAGARAWSNGGGTILVPLDGSPLAEEALGPAVKLATHLGAGLSLLRVVEPPSYATYGEGAQLILFDSEQELAVARSYLDQIAARLRDSGHAASVQAIEGSAVSTIANLAAGPGVMLVAMATHGRGGVARFVLGSVATGMLQRAQTPVLMVRPTSVGDWPAEVRADQESRTFDFTRGELDLLERAIDELIYHGGADAGGQHQARELRVRVAAARRQVPEEQG